MITSPPIIEGPVGTFVEDREHLVTGDPKCLEKLGELPSLLDSALDSENWRPLHYCFHPRAKLCEPLIDALLKRHADVNAQAKTGLTPFHLCCQMGPLSLIERMLEHKADIEMKAQGKTPLEFALCNKESISIGVLLRRRSQREEYQIAPFGEFSLLWCSVIGVLGWFALVAISATVVILMVGG